MIDVEPCLSGLGIPRPSAGGSAPKGFLATPRSGHAYRIDEETSIYVGWRVFQDRCARCHGVDASGSALAPDLLTRVREMGSRRFVNLVLQRYDWSLPAAEGGSEEAARESLVEEMLQRKEAAFAMPAWQDEPAVSARILDVYAYLSARSDGVQGPGWPAR